MYTFVALMKLVLKIIKIIFTTKDDLEQLQPNPAYVYDWNDEVTMDTIPAYESYTWL